MQLRAQVLTSQYDNARTNATLHETILTPANVNAKQFGKIFAFRVDGDVYAQPLFLPNVEVPGKGVLNVIYVATEHDSVYAFDAAGAAGAPLWHASFLKSGADTVPARDVRCGFIPNRYYAYPGDRPGQRNQYVLARAEENGAYVQKLHAWRSPRARRNSVVRWRSKRRGRSAARTAARRAATSKGQVYLTWGSSCDVGPYHGFVMAYDAQKLSQTAVFNTSPDSEESGIWQSDNGPAADGRATSMWLPEWQVYGRGRRL